MEGKAEGEVRLCPAAKGLGAGWKPRCWIRRDDIKLSIAENESSVSVDVQGIHLHCFGRYRCFCSVSRQGAAGVSELFVLNRACDVFSL